MSGHGCLNNRTRGSDRIQGPDQRSVDIRLSAFALHEKTNGEPGKVLPAAFAVVIFMMALGFVGLHESSARAPSGLTKCGCRFSRRNRVFDPRPAESSVYSENSRADARTAHAAPAPSVITCMPNNCHRTIAPPKFSVFTVLTCSSGQPPATAGSMKHPCIRRGTHFARRSGQPVDLLSC